MTAAFLVVMVALAVAIAVPIGEQADAESGSDVTITNLGGFLKAVGDSGYVFNGHGMTVKWSPSSACTNNTHSVADCPSRLPAADGNNAQRIQAPNAQYWLFVGAEDVRISNVNFVFQPADFQLCMNSTHGGSATADKIRNAEFQFQNKGNLTLTNCTFDEVIIAPYGYGASIGTTTIDGCSFQNVYDAYAIKDIHSVDATIKDSSFADCSGGMYFSGSNQKGDYTISNNTFENMDGYAEKGKGGTRGLIQLSKDGDYSNSNLVIENNSYSGDTPVFRQLNDSVTSAVLDVDAVESNNSFVAGVSFTAGTGVKKNGTLYVDTDNGDDTSGDGSKDEPYKSIQYAIGRAKAGDTILVSGTLNNNDHNGFQYLDINKPITIRGNADSPVHTESQIKLPEVNGEVTISNFSFDGIATIGAYNPSFDHSSLDLVIDGCEFTKAGGNCVYIQPQIHSLTVRGCHFISDNDAYAKQYLIWPYATETVTIENNTFEASGHIRAPIHLGNGHPDGTTAIIRNNTVSGFERVIQLAFTDDGASNSVMIDGNVFVDIQISSNSSAGSYQYGVVYIHENMVDGTVVSYMDNSLTGSGDRIFFSENNTIRAEDIVETFTDNTVNGKSVADVNDVSYSVVQITGNGDVVEISNGQGAIYSNGSYTDVILILENPVASVTMKGDVIKGQISLDIVSLSSPRLSDSIGILLTYGNISPESVHIEKILDAKAGREIKGCDVYFFSDDGRSGKVDGVIFENGKVSFDTDHCTEYDFVPVYRPIIPIMPDEDEDIPYIPPAPAVESSDKNDMEPKKVAAVAVASVAAAILAAFIIMDYRKN